MNVTILGNGGFGTALAVVLGGRPDVHPRLWGHDAEYTAEIDRTRRNPRYLPDAEVPARVPVTADGAAALAGADAVLVAVPTQHVRAVLSRLAAAVPAGVPMVSLAKGLELDSGRRPSEVIAEVVGPRPVLVLSGPSHAEELAHGQPATVVLAGGDQSVVQHLQVALSTPTMRIYRGDDPLGVELCGALKNVMAIAAGVAEGLGFGDNAKAAVVTRGLVEMARYGAAAGARRETFFGLAGVGDLAVTAFSPHGRNRAFGARVGAGGAVAEILASTRKVAEGYWTTRVVRDLAARLRVEMPITEALYQVLYEGADPRQAVRALMEREPKPEHGGG